MSDYGSSEDSNYLSAYPNLQVGLIQIGPEAVALFGHAIGGFFRYRETRLLVEAELSRIESDFAVYLHGRTSAERTAEWAFLTLDKLVDMAAKFPQHSELLKTILGMHDNLVRIASDFQEKSIKFVAERHQKR